MSYKGGFFSKPPPPICVGDPYQDKPLPSHGRLKGAKQFGIGKGMPQQKMSRLFEGEAHTLTREILANQRKEGKKKFLEPQGFRPSSSKSDVKPIPYISDGRGKPRRREAIRDISPKQIYTSPIKKACGGGAYSPTPKLCFTDVEYISSEYDNYKIQTAELHRKAKAKQPDQAFFIPKIDLNPITKGITAPDESKIRPHTTMSATKYQNDVKAFKPTTSCPPHDYPSHIADPYDEKKTKCAVTMTRLEPMTKQLQNMDEKLKERRAWTPNNPGVSTFQKSILFNNVKASNGRKRDSWRPQGIFKVGSRVTKGKR